jgi:hypothetical protein
MFAITTNDGFYIRQINSLLRISVIPLFDKRVYWNLDMTGCSGGGECGRGSCGKVATPSSTLIINTIGRHVERSEVETSHALSVG